MLLLIVYLIAGALYAAFMICVILIKYALLFCFAIAASMAWLFTTAKRYIRG